MEEQSFNTPFSFMLRLSKAGRLMIEAAMITVVLCAFAALHSNWSQPAQISINHQETPGQLSL